MDLTRAEDIKKWQEYTEELNKKDLHDTDNDYGVITHLEPEILKCQVKWALGSMTINSSLVAQMVKYLPTMWETRVQSLGREALLEKEMATHSSTLAWKIP